jgi:hypothetical protein
MRRQLISSQDFRGQLRPHNRVHGELFASRSNWSYYYLLWTLFATMLSSRALANTKTLNFEFVVLAMRRFKLHENLRRVGKEDKVAR